MAMDPLGMEDLLVYLALQGISVHVGQRRLQFLELQGANLNFTDKEARLRVVNKEHCNNINRCYRYLILKLCIMPYLSYLFIHIYERCFLFTFKLISSYFRRFVQKRIITVIPSVLYSVYHMERLKKLGIYILCYADIITPSRLCDFLQIVNTKKLVSCNENMSQVELTHYLRKMMTLHRALCKVTPVTSVQRIKKDFIISGNSLQSVVSEEQHVANASRVDQRQANVKNGIFSRDKSITHLFTNTQEEFIPLATSTQRLLQPKSSQIPSKRPKEYFQTTSGNNMNRFVVDYVNNEANRKNKLNRLHLANIFNANSVNRIASISKSKRVVEKCIQTEELDSTNIDQSLVTQNVPSSQPSSQNKTQQPNSSSSFFTDQIISSTDQGTDSDKSSFIIPLPVFEPIEVREYSPLKEPANCLENNISNSSLITDDMTCSGTVLKNENLLEISSDSESYYTSLSQIDDDFLSNIFSRTRADSISDINVAENNVISSLCSEDWSLD